MSTSTSDTPRFGKHGLYMEGSLIYRDTKDYIRRGLDNVGGMDFGFYENHGRAKTKGYNVSLRYSYAELVQPGRDIQQHGCHRP